MATALKHKQRSSRSYQEKRKVLGSVAVAAMSQSNSKLYANQLKKSWLETIKQMFGMRKKGDK